MGFANIDFPLDTVFVVTGAAGFIGSNIVEVLLDKGYTVKGVDNLSSGKIQNINVFLQNKNFHFYKEDIRNYEFCEKICENVDYVIHQAALGSVPRSMNEPTIYEDNNIKGTSNMMEAARINRVKRFVYASSSSVYGDSTNLPKVEGYEGNVLSPYALTKKVNEEYGYLYTHQYGLNCIGLRYFNVFGRRQDPDSQYAAVVPKFVKAIKNNEKVEIFGDGEQSRDFTYIDNVIEANLKACFAPVESCGKAYNIAYGERYTINQVYDLMTAEFNSFQKPQYKATRKGDIKHSLADITNARTKLGYSPQWSFQKGFNEAINWYKLNL